MSDLDDETKGLSPDEKIVHEAKKRFKRCQEHEADARKRFVEDIKFANGDPDNGYQWPDHIRNNREIDARPCLTINKTRQHNFQIINDARQNKQGVTIRPVGNGATAESAEVYEGVVRHIEYQSNAATAYDTATKFQVEGGIGYWRIVTDYADDDTFDQEIFIRRVKDPLAIYLDPDIVEKDGSDARFGFVFDDVPKDEFEALYPKHDDEGTHSPLGNDDDWAGEDYVRVAEYYRREQVADTLVAYVDPQTGERGFQPLSVLKEALPQDVLDLLLEDENTDQRELITTKIMWYKIAGDKVVDSREWPGKYIPIVRVVGDETVIDGKLDRKGHTRNLKDAQRQYNFWSSSAVEHVALQSKSPYVGPISAFENHETLWASANRENHAYLPYNAFDDQGRPVERPQRQEPPQMAPAYINGLQMALSDLMQASGQFQSQFGQNENATSGKAISERQRQGDNATYHFIDNLAVAIRFTGKILLDLIPKVYDTERVIRIMAEDGAESEVTIDPNAQAAFLKQQQQNAQEVKAIFNPKVGKYDVEADIGPAYATRRQEAFNALSQIAASNAELMHVIGDLLFKNADFPGADKIAERLERMVPPNVKGEGPDPQIQQLMHQNQTLQATLKDMVQKLAEKELQIKAKDADKSIAAFKAETDRLGTVANAVPELGSDQLHAVVKRTVAEMLGWKLDPKWEAHQPMLSEMDARDRQADMAAAQQMPQGMPGQ